MIDLTINPNHDAKVNVEIQDMYADVNIYNDTDAKPIRAHKVTLALGSPWFHKMFQASNETKDINVVFFGIPYKTIQSMIDIVYGKCVKISHKEKLRMLPFLNKLGVKWKEERQAEAEAEGRVEEKTDITKSIETKSNETGEETRRVAQIELDNLETMSVSPEKETQKNSFKSKKTLDIYDILDTWTQSNPSTIAVQAIKHTSYKNPQNENVSIYKCNSCVNLSKSFEKAKEHFMEKHQDYGASISVLVNAETFRRENFKKIEELMKRSNTSPLTTIQSHYLKEIIEKTQKHLENIDGIDKSKLPPTLLRKSKETTKNLLQFVEKVDRMLNI